MGISELRQVGAPLATPGTSESYAAQLVRSGAISASDMALVQLVQKHCDAPLERILLSEGLTDEDTLLKAHAAQLNTRCVSRTDMAGLPIRASGASAGDMLRAGVLPITDRDGTPAIVTHAPPVTTGEPAARMLMAPRMDVQAEIAQRLRTTLTEAAQARVSDAESCRSWGDRFGLRLGMTLGFLGLLCTLTIAFPLTVFALFAFWAALTLVVSFCLKLAAFIARLSRGAKASPLRLGPVPARPCHVSRSWCLSFARPRSPMP